MAHIVRVKILHTNFTGGPGYTYFHFVDATADATFVQSCRTAVDAFAGVMNSPMAGGTNSKVDNSVDVLDPISGILETQITTTGHAAWVSANTGNYGGTSGAVINLRTNTFLDGTRVKGKIFVVPMDNDAYDSDGTIADATITNLNNGIAAIVGAGLNYSVWHRPVAGAGGATAPILSGSTSQIQAHLRSRGT